MTLDRDSAAGPTPRPYKGLEISAVVVAILAVPALLWALLVSFAAGMKTVPRLTAEEALAGGSPSAVILLVLAGIFYKLIRNPVKPTYRLATGIGLLLSLLAVTLILAGFFAQH
jgi:hypothetical protein